MCMQSIIQRDIAFYQGEVERISSNLRRCPVEKEQDYTMQLRAAEYVLKALITYRNAIEGA